MSSSPQRALPSHRPSDEVSLRSSLPSNSLIGTMSEGRQQRSHLAFDHGQHGTFHPVEVRIQFILMSLV